MKLKLNYKLFLFLYLAILAFHLAGIFIVPDISTYFAGGVFQYLLFSPLRSFAAISSLIIAIHIIYDLTKGGKIFVEKAENKDIKTKKDTK